MSRQICRFPLFSTLQRHFTILLLPALPFLTGLLPLLYFLPAAGHLFPPPPLRKRRVGHKGKLENCDTSHDGGDKKAPRKKSGGKGESFSRADK